MALSMICYVLLAAATSVIFLLLAGAKWKIPLRVAGPGGVGVSLLAAIPFFWVYPACLNQGALGAALLGQVALAMGLAAAGLMFVFWRDPERVPPEISGAILSPADGQVAYVMAMDDDSVPMVRKQGRDYRLEELTGASPLNGPAWVIGVEMNFLNVHVNRCPIGGQVRLLKHIPGRFISLRKDEAPFVNERLTTVIAGPLLSVGVVQVASRLVRRVQSYLRVGQIVSAGQRLGMIRFGSLVAVVMPQGAGLEIQVSVGDRVTAGVSVLAQYSQETADRTSGEGDT